MAQRIITLAGSARRESVNKQLARVAAARVSALGGEGVFLDLADYRMPLYDGDYEAAEGVPDNARALGEQVASADGLMIASPEYNGSHPALLKNTIDWLTRINRRIWVRPTALLSASPGPRGGRRALVVLRLALDHMRVPVLDRQFSLPSAREAMAGDALTDPALLKQLDRLVTDLLAAAGSRRAKSAGLPAATPNGRSGAILRPAMANRTNRAWTLAARPHGVPKLTDFALTETAVPDPGPGEVLIATHYHSLDPYMRGRMAAPSGASYAAAVPIGGVMEGDAVGEVVASNSDRFAVGDFAMGKIGWQEFGVMDARDVRKIDPDAAPISTSVGILGMPGLTAYHGLFEVAKPVAGDTVVVTAASGAVGAVVGQLARHAGCRVIGVAGSPEKVAYVVDELGFDAAIDYKTEDVPARFRELCPRGINVYWDNVGGPVTDAAIDQIAVFGRAVICGQIAFYNATSPPQGPRNIPRMLLTRRARMEGFLVFQFVNKHEEALARLGTWIRDGVLKYREDVVEGIENSPEAFIGLLAGANFGKLVIKVR